MHFNDILFSAAIRQKRASDRLGLRQVQKETGISASTLSRIERGAFNIDLLTFVTLCNWLKVGPEQFFTDSAEGEIRVTTLEEIEIMLRAEGSKLSEAIAEVLRLIRYNNDSSERS